MIDWLKNLWHRGFWPVRTAEDVAAEIIAGLEDGTIVLDNEQTE